MGPKEGEKLRRTPKIELVHKLDMDKFLQNSNEGFRQGRSGNLLLFSIKDGDSYRPAAIEYIPRAEGEAAPGFFLHEEKGVITSLENSAVIFDQGEGTTTFVYPSPPNYFRLQVNGIKIDHKRHAVEISESQVESTKKLLEARTKAREYCNKKYSPFKAIS
jgi:hypothetical protein